MRKKTRTKSIFFDDVYRVIKKIPVGKVATYGQIAVILGRPGAARVVGQVLHRSPYAPAVPCHRVVAADGRLCGFARGLEVKEKLLRKEGVEVCNLRVDLKKHLW